MSWYILDDKREADRVIAETNGMINEDDHEAGHDDNDQAPIIQNEVVPDQLASS